MPINETDFTTGSEVVTADGEKYGTVYGVSRSYLQARVPQGMLTDVERFIPADLVDRVEGESVILNKTKEELESLDLTTPPAVE